MDDTWIQYHATRLNLIQSIETHLKSVAAFNVYNNGSRKDIPLNTSGDYNLTNELMGYDLMNELKNKLTVEVDLMTEQNEAQFMIQAANKDKSYQERQQARKELKDLLTRFNSDDLIDMIMNEEDNKN
jgi:hypothetical protein